MMERSSKEMQRWLRKERDSRMCTTQHRPSLSCTQANPLSHCYAHHKEAHMRRIMFVGFTADLSGYSLLA